MNIFLGFVKDALLNMNRMIPKEVLLEISDVFQETEQPEAARRVYGPFHLVFPAHIIPIITLPQELPGVYPCYCHVKYSIYSILTFFQHV